MREGGREGGRAGGGSKEEEKNGGRKRKWQGYLYANYPIAFHFR